MSSMAGRWAGATALCGALMAWNANAAINVDGIPDEADWQQAQTLGPLVTVQPLTQATPAQPTNVRLLSTPEGLAFAFVNQHADGTPRVKPRSLRDQGGNADRVNVMIDFDGDGKLGYNFMVSLSDSIDDLVIS